MTSENFSIQLIWTDLTTGYLRQPQYKLPVAIGRKFSKMPSTIGEDSVSRLELKHTEISGYHALINLEKGNLVIVDQNSTNGIFINGLRQTKSLIKDGDVLQLGPYKIDIRINFPPPWFVDAEKVKVSDLRKSGYTLDEADYGTIGGGLGSFIWVDFLRIFGVKSNQIVALGIVPLDENGNIPPNETQKSYWHYKQLCLNSQIPDHERLRSNSDSCPDNIWGWPSYALREAWQDFSHGRILSSLKCLWQVFAEPTFAQTYTPKARNVFASIDREAKRIGWDQIFRFGRVRAIRKTDDGRYAIAYSFSSSKSRDYGFLIVSFVHLATGYPKLKFLEDLQMYRRQTEDFRAVVNAYEDHAHVYEHLEKNGGVVLIRGRGIVASRIIQRIYEVRQRSQKNIGIIHLMRSEVTKGKKFGVAQRQVENNFEFQPFNWPKACWGGELRVKLEQAKPEKRKDLLKEWGGTTTASRSDWRQIIQQAKLDKWYKVEFGKVTRVEPNQGNGIITHISTEFPKLALVTDFIIDATGLEANVDESPLIYDLVKKYNLQLNAQKRLTVSNDFEVIGVSNEPGKIYACGAITFGGPYAAVDSFLGLQYTALRCVDHLFKIQAPGIKYLNGFSSIGQWWKWATNQSPS
ncbi:FHA domain-containing protein [Trichodesmium erythraeum 21-75]|nr:FHA domain-containing protein [Trichodesmium erythraeum 21-75]